MGLVNVGARRRAASKKPLPRVNGVCVICNQKTRTAVIVKGRKYTDSDGVQRQAADTTYCRQCRSMQSRGLLNAGADRPAKDSSGNRCGGCNTIIEQGDKHAHRNGVPFHRECLL